MIVAAHQPQYLPWAGYFDKMDRADAFVLLDTVQFKKNEWQNRNRFRTAEGWQWVTVPVLQRSGQLIGEVNIDPSRSTWARKHAQALKTCYGSAPHCGLVADRLEPIWEGTWELLSPLNCEAIRILMELLGLETPVHLASQLSEAPEEPDLRLIEFCRQLGADTYLAGAGGPDYMDMARWEESGIEVVVQHFEHPIYEQPFDEFVPGLSIVDLLCSRGPGALSLIREANGRAADQGR